MSSSPSPSPSASAAPSRASRCRGPISAAAVALAASLSLAIAGCASVGPDYERPGVAAGATAPSFKEVGPWQPAVPGTIRPDEAWWSLFGDPMLDSLMSDALAANPGIAVAEAQFRQAQAAVAQARAGFFPTLGLSVSANRARTLSSTGLPMQATSHASGLSAAWEPDLWGRVRRQVEAGEADAAASAADLAAARLAIQAEVASDYLQLRVTDQQRALYARTVAAYERSLALTQSQFKAGVATNSDVALATATLRQAQAAGRDLDLTRAQFEHAIAILIGRTPSELSIAVIDGPLPARLPAIPVGVPSELLQRRPDIAAAERLAAAANAQIGVAQAAWYPGITLGASGGYDGLGLGPLFATPGRVWALGASLAATLFDGGLRRAQGEAARAAFDAAAGTYRQTVLGGFQEVEDNLAALRVLADELQTQEQAVSAARQSLQVLTSQYRAGTTNYLSIVTAQALVLTNERTAVQLTGRQFVASVALIKAIGGGWSPAASPASPTSPTSPTPTTSLTSPAPATSLRDRSARSAPLPEKSAS